MFDMRTYMARVNLLIRTREIELSDSSELLSTATIFNDEVKSWILCNYKYTCYSYVCNSDNAYMLRASKGFHFSFEHMYSFSLKVLHQRGVMCKSWRRHLSIKITPSSSSSSLPVFSLATITMWCVHSFIPQRTWWPQPPSTRVYASGILEVQQTA